jgi:hypothetical protein
MPLLEGGGCFGPLFHGTRGVGAHWGRCIPRVRKQNVSDGVAGKGKGAFRRRGATRISGRDRVEPPPIAPPSTSFGPHLRLHVLVKTYLSVEQRQLVRRLSSRFDEQRRTAINFGDNISIQCLCLVCQLLLPPPQISERSLHPTTMHSYHSTGTGGLS